MFKTTRRGFLVGCSAAIASMTGGLSFTAFGSPEQEPNQDILVVIFLRGGMDGLNVVPPLQDPDREHYEGKRPELQIPTSGDGAAINLDDRFGLHPAAAALHGLYQDKRLAIVHAAGLTSDTRSHFDAMQYMELGTPDSKRTGTGWLTRHLSSAGNLPDEIMMPAMSVGNMQPSSLAGSREAIGMSSPRDFHFGGHWRYSGWQRQALRDMYQGSSWLHQAGIQTLDAIDVVEWSDPGEYEPANGAEYPSSTFGRNMQAVAQMVKMQLGLRIATVDLGGWDTHDYQGDRATGYFASRLGELSQGLAALYADLDGSDGSNYNHRLTTIVMSEFGRSGHQNSGRGTDHGHGNVILVLGGKVNGGKVFGNWPGLQTDQLYDRRDLAITTDYRRVLSEILIRRLGNPNLGTVFPGYKEYQPMGIVQGADIAPVYTEANPTPTVTPNPLSTPGAADEHRVFLPSVQK